jgi:ParB family chromosome partitioning protein
LLEAIKSGDCTPSLSQAIQLKKLSQDGKLDRDAISCRNRRTKANQTPKVTIRYSAVQKYYPNGTTPHEIEGRLL